MKTPRCPICQYVLATAVALAVFDVQAAELPYQASGLKVGEVTDNSAIVWTRLTQRPQRNPSDGPYVEIVYADDQPGRSRRRRVTDVIYPEGVTVADIRDAVPGTAGQTRTLYRPRGVRSWTTTDWADVDAQRDFTRQFLLTDLSPSTAYQLRVESRNALDKTAGQTLEGGFRTAPRADDAARVVFTVSTGQAYNDQDRPDGFNIYPVMRDLDPDFFVHTGDIVYYDRLAKTAGLARYHWQRTYSLPTNVDFHSHTASYFIKDDHDALMNDCWPTKKTDYMFRFTFAQGLAIFREQVPMGERTYRSRRWGKDLQVWMVEGRDFRSANTDPDGPDKTIWGKQQKKWFKESVQGSDATFRILISPTPLVGPDRDNKKDNHSNKNFTHEGDELRQFIASQKNMVVICGDRHWQYMSVHPATKVREYSCGPASDQHAGGWKKDDFRPQYHRYLNVIGGFLSVTAERIDGTPKLFFRFHDVAGQVRFEDQIAAQVFERD